MEENTPFYPMGFYIPDLLVFVLGEDALQFVTDQAAKGVLKYSARRRGYYLIEGVSPEDLWYSFLEYKISRCTPTGKALLDKNREAFRECHQEIRARASVEDLHPNY